MDTVRVPFPTLKSSFIDDVGDGNTAHIYSFVSEFFSFQTGFSVVFKLDFNLQYIRLSWSKY